MRRWVAAALGAALTVLVVGVPTDLVDTPVFGREIPPTWWSWPALLASAVLSGMLLATYGGTPLRSDDGSRRGWGGGVLIFFAVGCPVCNKLVLLALGSAGALTWFEPVQPLLSLAAVALLGWALVVRLSGEVTCRLPKSVDG